MLEGGVCIVDAVTGTSETSHASRSWLFSRLFILVSLGLSYLKGVLKQSRQKWEAFGSWPFSLADRVSDDVR